MIMSVYNVICNDVGTEGIACAHSSDTIRYIETVALTHRGTWAWRLDHTCREDTRHSSALWWAPYRHRITHHIAAIWTRPITLSLSLSMRGSGCWTSYV